MDATRIDALKTQIQRDLDLTQCIELESLVRQILSAQAGQVVLARKTERLAETRRCPHCQHDRILKHGRDARGLQRFRCLRTPQGGCGRTFNPLTRTPLARMRKPDLWLRYAEAMTDYWSLDAIRDSGLPIARLTAWRWRHRFLALPQTLQAARLGGVVEVDETYYLRAFKGHRGWKRGQPPEHRPPRYHGTPALKRGLSGQQVPILTALDRTGGRIEAVLPNKAVPTILGVLAGRIEPESVICSDGHAAYPVLAGQCGAKHRVFVGQKPRPAQVAQGLPPRTPGALTLGRVNAYHERLRTILHRILRGVSTRYLSAYLGWIRFMERGGRRPLALIEKAAFG